MAVILVILYAFYFIIIGAVGSANSFLTMVEQEKQFLYWAIVLLIIAGLWNLGGAGSKFGPAFAVLIIVGFLLANKNGITIFKNAAAILPALGGNAGSGATGGGLA